MNLPNKLTLLRVILVPFFVAVLLLPAIPHHYLWAFLLFAVASLTDHFDGRIARKNNQVTTFGKFLDPIADKILVISALVSFVQLGLAPTWCVLLIIAREFMVTSIRLVAVEGGKVIAANSWGKVKTVSQMSAIIVTLLLQYFVELGFVTAGAPIMLIGSVLIYLATVLTVISGAVYLKENIEVISNMK